MNLIKCLLAVLALLLVLGLVNAPVAHADDPVSPAPPASQYRVLLDAFYRGGSLNGYGHGQAISVTASPSSTIALTGASADGVNVVFLLNTGSNVVIGSLNGAQPSTSNAAFIVPANAGFTSTTKSKSTALRVYCPSGTSTLYAAW